LFNSIFHIRLCLILEKTTAEARSKVLDKSWEKSDARMSARDRSREFLASAMKVPGTTPDADSKSFMFYSHSDTQPHDGTGWTNQDDPTKETRITTDSADFLCGRGTADDEHGVLITTVAAIKALIAAGKTFPTVYIFFETGEESGSPNLTKHLELAEVEMGGPPAAVFVLDAGGPS
jgi:acetylornithine deacetylase/succinyl-diaminopimelate desuccinylase-like protein